MTRRGGPWNLGPGATSTIPRTAGAVEGSTMGTVASMRPRGKSGCPMCGKPVMEGHKPFCSARCRQLDLGRWLSGSYAIPGEAATSDDPATPPPEDKDNES